MSELQIGLIVIGVAIVAAVFGYNKWQETRYRRQAEANVSAPGEDVLMRPQSAAPRRLEPTLDDAGGPPAGTGVHETVPERLQRTAPASPPVLSDALDFIVLLEGRTPVAGQAIVEAAEPALQHIARPVHIDGEAGGWEALDRGQPYDRLRVGLQLVDRRGPVTAKELEEFEAAVLRLATTLGMRASAGDRRAAIGLAGSLDRFCGETDIQIAVHLVAGTSPFTGTAIGALAAASGLALEHDGRFRLRDAEGSDVFSLSNEESASFRDANLEGTRTSALLMELDVPRAAGGREAFERFREFALRAASELGGRLVDDNRNPLTAASFDAIAAQLEPVYEAMAARGFPAGGVLARRLFS